MAAAPPASDPPQALETGQDHLSCAAATGTLARRCGQGGGQRPALVAELGHDHQRSLSNPLLRRAGASPARRVTSTLRTARCGSACRVVWQGRREILTAPYADCGKGKGWLGSLQDHQAFPQPRITVRSSRMRYRW